MSNERILLDTVYVQALIDGSDQNHLEAKKLFLRTQLARELWITEAVLIEVANALCEYNRTAAIDFIEQCYIIPSIKVVAVDSALLRRGINLYTARLDKRWSLTDCISFVVMQEQKLMMAATADRHFLQAGFRALMLETV